VIGAAGERGFGRTGLLIVAAVLAFGLVPASDAGACTLWAAAGERAAGDGALIAKNRDWTPEADDIRLAGPEKGLRFVGLFPIREEGRPGVVAGINEKGVVVVTATAGSVPQGERGKGKAGLAQKVLTQCGSVQEVIADRALFSRGRPAIYLLADRERIAWIEVAPGGRMAVETKENGTLTHTNHFLAQELRFANTRIGKSSASRLDRIGQLLAGGPQRLGLEEFMAYSLDAHAGPDHSIFRTGSRPNRERTLATWIVALPKHGDPELFVRLADPGEPVKELRWTLGAAFWRRPNGTIAAGG
jgi:hypothetical protein